MTKQQNQMVINQDRLLQIIHSPSISEKAAIIAEKNRQFAFKVATDATKPEIKKAIELLFEVRVSSVRVCNVKGKIRRFKQMIGRRKGWKKAYVSLKEGFDIDFTGTK